MARRLCFDERVRIEAMSAAGFSAAAVAQRLGRHRATIQRELAGNGGSFAYRAGDAQAAACGRARLNGADRHQPRARRLVPTTPPARPPRQPNIQNAAPAALAHPSTHHTLRAAHHHRTPRQLAQRQNPARRPQPHRPSNPNQPPSAAQQ